VDRLDLVDLPDIVDILYARPERFIIYCDDLSFDAGEPGYRASWRAGRSVSDPPKMC
jgi:hypothetical protein